MWLHFDDFGLKTYIDKAQVSITVCYFITILLYITMCKIYGTGVRTSKMTELYNYNLFLRNCCQIKWLNNIVIEF